MRRPPEHRERIQRLPVQSSLVLVLLPVLTLVLVSSTLALVATASPVVVAPTPAVGAWTPLADVHALEFARAPPRRTAHCEGGSARHHEPFYPERVRCVLENTPPTLADADWVCAPLGPRAAFTVVRAPRVACRCGKSNGADGSNMRRTSNPRFQHDQSVVHDRKHDARHVLVDVASCQLWYTLDFRAEILSVLAALATLAVFSLLAVAAHLVLAPPSTSATARRVLLAHRAHGVDPDYPSASCESYGSIRDDGPMQHLVIPSLELPPLPPAPPAYSPPVTRTLHHLGPLWIPSREIGGREGPGPRSEAGAASAIAPNLPHREIDMLGDFGRMIIRNFSEGSLHFSSTPSSPPPSPPAAPPPTPARIPCLQQHEQRIAELLFTDLF